MKVDYVTIKQIILQLEPEEVQWLKAMVQNPLKEDEDPIDTEMRRKFWRALQGVSS